MAAISTPVCFYAMFTGFQTHDDEGYILLSLRQYLQGGVLYDQLYSQYGPAYFQLFRVVFEVLQLEVTHTNGRICTMVVWLSTAALCGIATYRLTRNLPVALCSQLIVFDVLVPLQSEPLHPGGVLCLILSATVVAGLSLHGPRRTVAAASIGVLLAAAMLMKINVGILALASTTFVLVVAARTGRHRSALEAAALLAMLAAPFVLTAGHWNQSWVRVYAWVVCCATLAVALILIDAPAKSAGVRRDVIAMLVSFSVTGAISCGWAVAGGTSAAGLLDGILLGPIRQPNSVMGPLKLSPGAPWWAALSVLLCLLFLLGRRRLHEGRGFAAVHALAQLLAGAVIWSVALEYIQRSAFTVSLPLLWIPLTTHALDKRSGQTRLGKSLLGAIAVLQALHAYPVAGAQQSWATFLFIPVGAIGIAEGWRNAISSTRGLVGAPRFAIRLGPLLATALLLLTVRAAAFQPGQTFKRLYDTGLPLSLRGAQQIRVPAPQARVYRWLTDNLSSRCKAFITLPGLNSLYLFAGLEPPTMRNTNEWMSVFSASEQAEIRDRFSRMPPPLCVVRNRLLVDLWTYNLDVRPNLQASPLVRYIDEQFTTVSTLDGFEFMVQRN